MRSTRFAGIPLFFIAYGGNRALTKFSSLARHTEAIKKIFGALMILTAVGLYFNFEVVLQQFAVKYLPTVQIENISAVREEFDKLRPPSRFSEEAIAAFKYDVLDLKGAYGRHKVSLLTPEGVSAYAFTFGDEMYPDTGIP